MKAAQFGTSLWQVDPCLSRGQGSTQGSFQHQRLNCRSKFRTRLCKMSPVLIPEGKANSCSASLPGYKVRRQTEQAEEDWAPLQDKGHAIGASLAATPPSTRINSALQKAAALATGSCLLQAEACVTASWGPGWGLWLADCALPEQGLSQSLAPPPQRSLNVRL